MLIQLRVENHRSLRDEQVLSLAAASLGDPGDPRLIHSHAVSEALLPALAIYGANASGKTNVLHALGFMRDAVVHSYRLWEPDSGIPNEPFALSHKENAPSLYEVEIVAESVRFRYGFVISETRIEEEWLYAWPNGHKQTWFEREGEDFNFGRNLHGDNEAIRALTRGNSLFLSVAAQNNHVALTPVFRWFRMLQVDSRRGRASGLGSYASTLLGEMFTRQLSLFGEEQDGARDRQAILELLQAADTGIVDMKVDDLEPGSSAATRLQRRRTRLQFRHKSEEPEHGGAWLPLEVESAGTVALIELAPKLTRALRYGGLVCIDEMEASLHPMLALSLLRLFQDPHQNAKGAQLLFTTHDTNLLGTALGAPPLRRDQIWFTEKDGAGASHLYPLTDFHPRKQENLERGYLQGRYGAIPFLGELVAGPERATDEDGK
jgi:uncharacterized protein